MEWINPKEKLPEDGQSCHILIDRGWACDVIVCGVPFKAEVKAWLDPFATPDAGSLYGIAQVGAWCPEADISMPPDSYFEQAV